MDYVKFISLKLVRIILSCLLGDSFIYFCLFLPFPNIKKRIYRAYKFKIYIVIHFKMCYNVSV